MYRLLSYPLETASPLYKNTKKVCITGEKKIKNGDSCNTYRISFSNHSGTHIDTPKHFFENGKSINNYNVNELIFNSPLVIKCPKKENELITAKDLDQIKRKCDILLIKTGFCLYRGSPEYKIKNPGISKEAALHIRKKFDFIKCVGVDSISVSSANNPKLGREVHKILLNNIGYPGEPLLLIEDINLSGDLRGFKKIFAIPIFIGAIDSAPCTVIAEF